MEICCKKIQGGYYTFQVVGFGWALRCGDKSEKGERGKEKNSDSIILLVILTEKISMKKYKSILKANNCTSLYCIGVSSKWWWW